MKNAAPIQIAERLERKSAVARRLFATEDGKEFLKALDDEFLMGQMFVKGDSHQTAYNLGSRDVVVYIHQVLRFKADEIQTI